jgi:hypothetical protein
MSGRGDVKNRLATLAPPSEPKGEKRPLRGGDVDAGLEGAARRGPARKGKHAAPPHLSLGSCDPSRSLRVADVIKAIHLDAQRSQVLLEL